MASLCLALLTASCAARTQVTPAPSPDRRVLQTSEGLASYYGRDFQGRRTASGVRFDMKSFVAAHPSFPFGTVLRVTNLANGRAVSVRIVDRGPVRQLIEEGVIVDLSYAAAQALGFIREGRARVRLDVVRWGR